MGNYDQSKLWQRTLAPKKDDIYHKERELLRVEYENLRIRATTILNEISHSLPEFTIHSIDHADALWSLADQITDDDFSINPAEIYVLGGAFLLHDLGMALAAYPNGIEQIKKEPIWDDISNHLRKKKNVSSTSDDLLKKQIEKETLEHVLRLLHAKHAESIVFTPWRDPSSDTTYYLIDQPELRESYGSIIGKISHSHWWPVDELLKKLPPISGAPGMFPKEWTIDPIKIATILRIADAANIDDRRSSGFLRTVRKITGYSGTHWRFQQNLYQPRLENERLVFTSKMAFDISEANSWWLCYDTLKLLDYELKEVDSLLADTGRQRLKVIGVAGIEEPERLCKLIPVENWKPVDAKIKVGNVAKIALKLGGTELYGKDYFVPIRELIQNGADAIRARREIEKETKDWGEIHVRIIEEDDEVVFIEVEDNGVGMSTKVLTGPFLDFGESFWGSELMHEELPGLESTNFESTGKFGIGFFSVFMLGEGISVITRRFEDARENTWCLDFLDGVNSRPILRKAKNEEFIKHGGTKIRIKTTADILKKIPNLNARNIGLWTFEEWLERMCASLDVDIYFQRNNEKKIQIIKANDWITIAPKDLLKRLIGSKNLLHLNAEEKNIIQQFENMDLIIQDGKYVGRCVIGVNYRYHLGSLLGMTTVGGLYSNELHNLGGIVCGQTSRASRDAALPIGSLQKFKEWASKQLVHAQNSTLRDSDKENIAGLVWQFEVFPTDLPIGQYKGKYITPKQLTEVLDSLDNVTFLEYAELYDYEEKFGAEIKWRENVVICEDFTSHFSDGFEELLPTRPITEESLLGVAFNILSKAWNVDIEHIYKLNYQIRDTTLPKLIIGKILSNDISVDSYVKFDRKDFDSVNPNSA